MTVDVAETTEFRMPSLGADMTEGRVTEWLVKPGDRVERGQIVVIVETDKADIEVEVFQPGTVVQLLVAEGQKVPVGEPIALIATGPGIPARPALQPVETAPPEAPATTPAEPPASEPAPGHVTSPLIRRLASDLHVDVAHLQGSGPGGRVHRDDVATAGRPPRRARITPRARHLIEQHGLAAGSFEGHSLVTGDDIEHELTRIAAEAPPPTRAETMRLQIGRLMARSWAEIPHYHVAKRLDLSTMLAGLRDRNESRSLQERVLPAAVLLCASARAAAATPACNGWWRDGRFEPAGGVRLGVVLSLREGGIVVPTIEDADGLSTIAMMARLSELVQRARHGRLRGSDLIEASITVTNLGDLGAEVVYGVIHPPQVALIGFGSVHDEVWPDAGGFAARPTVHASLAGDHRASDGLTGSRLLGQMQAILDTIVSEET